MPKFITKGRLNALACRMQQGDVEASGRIFDYFSPLFFGYFAKRVLNREVAEDLVQEIFLRIIKNIRSFDETSGDFSSWVWRIAKNRLIDYYREKKSISFCDLEILKEAKETSADGDCLHHKILAENVCRIVGDFRPEEQSVFTLRFISDLSYKEMAELTGRSEESLRISVFRLRNKLKKIFHDKIN
ncbi:MAG: sigma-70 family RNA polymerase sigma factor [Candidatus Pacebacteria bacterium]|nr:sigma-70 family RNA polymerase sigma factor [Candidatus Paceibacterota bacterium]MDR3582992.1 sigma-70 family RNA polymerase sigma factor [Candidatus Paceibacterota bacterium]